MSLHCQMNLISICQPLYNLVTINYVHWLPEQIKQSSRARFFWSMSHNFFVLEINMLLCVLQVSISLRGPFLF